MNHYLLGQAIAAFDRDLQRFTPTCIDNLLRIPSRAAVILRHAWKDMLSMPSCRELLDRIDWRNFPRSEEGDVSFWLGFYHARKSGVTPHITEVVYG